MRVRASGETIAGLQALFMFLAFLFFGIPNAFFWGFITFFAAFILISITYRRTYITVIMSIFIIIFFTTIYPNFEQRLSLLKNKEEEELKRQINISNRKINKNTYF